MTEYERHACLMMDEMQITPGLIYDPSADAVLGRPTIPLADGSLPADTLATHGLVFMLGGVTTRWKQVIGYHLTGNCFHALSVKQELLKMIRACEDIGLKIDAVVSDMGGGNQALWRLFLVRVGKHSRPNCSATHPCDSNRKLWFIADAPHLLKNLRNHLTRGQTLYLPDDIVVKAGLSTNAVLIEPIKKLIEIDSKGDFKLAPHLKQTCVDPGHYEKMKVGPAYSLFNVDTGAALRILVEKGLLEKSALATAWFIETVAKWFRIMTSRTTKLALSKVIETERQASIDFLKNFVVLFEGLSIGTVKNAPWKPVQTGAILSTLSVLELQEYFLSFCKFRFLFLSRFCQDALENFFSTLRAKHPIPRLYEFKCALRSATLAQFLHASADGSYTKDGGFLLAGLSSDTEDSTTQTDLIPADIHDMNMLEHESFLYFAGYVVHSAKKLVKDCDACVSAMTGNKDVPRLTQLKSYKEKLALCVASEAVVEVLKVAESHFQKNKEQHIHNHVPVSATKIAVKSAISCNTLFPHCHNVLEAILSVFFSARMHIQVRKETLALSVQIDNKCGSKSVGMRAAVANLP